MGLDIGGLDIGALMDIGARRAFRGPANVVIRKQPLLNPYPGVTPPHKQLQPIPLGSTTIAPGATTATLQVTAQVNFVPRRPTLVVGRVGASVAATVVLLTAYTVGTVPQLKGVAGAGVPVEMFGPGAFDTNTMGTAATPGIQLTLTFLASNTPGAGDSITIAGGIMSEVIGN